MTLKHISNFETQSLNISDSKACDAEKLDEIRESVRYMTKWSSKNADDMDITFAECFEKGWDVPPGRSSDEYQMMTVLNKHKDIVGYLGLFHKYPDEETLWISIAAIGKAFQGKGYAKECILGLIGQLMKSKQYKNIELAVDLKNWGALQFWRKSGFDRFDRYFGDKEYSEDSFAKIVLKKELI